MNSYDLFISYNKNEKTLAQKLYNSFTKIDFTVFLDSKSILPGESIPSAISNAIENSTHMICLISNDWLSSEFCKLERDIEIMDDPSAHDRKIIPLLVEDVELPKMLKRLKYIDFKGWSTGYRKLFAELRKVVKKNVISRM